MREFSLPDARVMIAQRKPAPFGAGSVSQGKETLKSMSGERLDYLRCPPLFQLFPIGVARTLSLIGTTQQQGTIAVRTQPVIQGTSNRSVCQEGKLHVISQTNFILPPCILQRLPIHDATLTPQLDMANVCLGEITSFGPISTPNMSQM